MAQANQTPSQNPQEGELKPYVYIYERAAILYNLPGNFDLSIYFVEPLPESIRQDTPEALLNAIRNHTISSIGVDSYNGVQVLTVNRRVRYTIGYNGDQVVRVPYAEDTSEVTLHLGDRDVTFEVSDDMIMELLEDVIKGKLSVRGFAEAVAELIETEAQQAIELFYDRLDALDS